MEAFGLFDVYCILSLSGASEVMVDDQNHHPWRHPSEGSLLGVKPEGLLGQQIYMGTSWPPCLYLVICYGLNNGLSTFLDCNGVSGEVGQFSNPCTCSYE